MILLFLIEIVTAYALTCKEVIELPDERKLTKAELESIEPTDIVHCMAHLGREKLPEAEAIFVWQSIVKFYNGIENIPDKILSELHWITVAITPEEYCNITMNDIDVVQNFGLNYHLNETQLSAIATQVLQSFASKEPEDYTYYDLSALRQILCAFNRTVIEKIRPAAYREAAILIGNLERCAAETFLGFASLAVHEDAFGNPENWNEDTVKTIGKVAEFMPKGIIQNIKNIPPSD